MKILDLTQEQEIIIAPQNILDLPQGRLLKEHAILVNRGRVERVSRETELGTNKKVIRLEGIIIMPGLIDCHVHLALDGINFEQAQQRRSSQEIMQPYLLEVLKNTLASGVVALRDGGDREGYGLWARDKLPGWGIPGPLIKASGSALRKDQYYGSFLGQGVNTLAEIQAQIDTLVSSGVDQIKVLVSGIVSFKEYGKVGKLQFTEQELSAIVRAAHARNLKVMAHASSAPAVRLAIQAGVDSIEHGYFLDDCCLQAMADKEIPWIPTVVPVSNQLEMPWKNSFSEEELDVIDRTLGVQLERIAQASELGVKLGVGTDSGAGGTPHGPSYFTELRWYQKAGLCNLNILNAATVNSAAIIGLSDYGSIQPGMRAIFLGLKGNPLENLNELRDVQLISCL